MSRRRKKQNRAVILPALILIILITAAVLLVCRNKNLQDRNAETETLPAQTAELPAAETSTAPVPTASAAATTAPAADTSGEPVRDYVYSAYTYQLVTDIVTYYRTNHIDYAADIEERLGELKDIDPDLGDFWEKLVTYWEYVNSEQELNYDVLPDGLPQDDSLCIVVLGYQLEPDGSMAQELVQRCQTALASAEKYPNAFIAVTGGDTATAANKTEGGAMADWLTEHGIDSGRILVEDESMTTSQNAGYTIRLLREQAPQVTSLAIVTSNYHVAEGCLVFQEEALLDAYRYDYQPMTVVSNACTDMGESVYGGISFQASDVWNLAAPTY